MHSSIDPSLRTLTLAIPGNILSTNVEALRKEIFELTAIEAPRAKEWKDLVLDLSPTKMIDSAGLNFLVSLVRNMSEREGKVRACSLQPNIQRTFTFTRLDQHIEVIPAPPAPAP